MLWQPSGQSAKQQLTGCGPILVLVLKETYRFPSWHVPFSPSLCQSSQETLQEPALPGASPMITTLKRLQETSGRCCCFFMAFCLPDKSRGKVAVNATTQLSAKTETPSMKVTEALHPTKPQESSRAPSPLPLHSRTALIPAFPIPQHTGQQENITSSAVSHQDFILQLGGAMPLPSTLALQCPMLLGRNMMGPFAAITG